jgi:hypothetical protein
MKRLPRDTKEKKEKKKLNRFFEVVFFVHFSLSSLLCYVTSN